MNKALIRFVVSKYLKFDPSQPFISITALLAFAGVGLGVFVLIVAMAIMNGFDNEFEKKLFTMNYPITLYPRQNVSVSADLVQTLRTQFPQYRFSPFLRASAIAKKDDIMEGVLVFGVETDMEKPINDVVAQSLGNGGLQPFEALIGKKLQDEFSMNSSDKVTIIFADGAPQGLGITPIMKRFDVRKTFSSGLLAYDKGYVYVNAKDLARVLGKDEGSYDGIHIYAKNPLEDIKTLSQALPQDRYALIGWWQQNGNFFAALALEKRALFVVLMLIILVASLNIVSSLLMTVMSRRKEIALLLSLGADKKEIRSIFFRLGAIIGGGGIVVGMALALIALAVLANFDVISLPADVYGTTKLPLDLSIVDFFLIVIGSLAVVALSSYYPAKKASEVDPLTVLRNE